MEDKKSNGITLVALVITIIVLLILAGVTIMLVIGQESIFETAKRAKLETKIATAKEHLELKASEVVLNKEGNATLKDFAEYLQIDNNEEYAISLTRVSSLVGTMPDLTNANEMYVMYNGFEFKVDKQFKISYTGETTSNGEETSGGNNQGNTPTIPGSTSASSVITNVSFDLYATYNRVNVDNIIATTINDEEVIGYHVFLTKKNDNSNIKTVVTEETNVRFTSLERSTEYVVYVVAYDIQNNPKQSAIQTISTTNEPERLIPILTSNTSAGGTAFSSNLDNSTVPYYAFDGNIPTTAAGFVPGYVVTNLGTCQIGYDFGENNSKIVQKIVYYGHPKDANVKFTSMTLQYKDSPSEEWHDLQTFTPVVISTYNDISDLAQEFTVTVATTPHRYWQINGINSGRVCVGLLELEFWGF